MKIVDSVDLSLRFIETVHGGVYNTIPGIFSTNVSYEKRLIRSLFLSSPFEESESGLSPRNENEANIVVNLVHYFVHFIGVNPTKITVITPYKVSHFLVFLMAHI